MWTQRTSNMFRFLTSMVVELRYRDKAESSLGTFQPKAYRSEDGVKVLYLCIICRKHRWLHWLASLCRKFSLHGLFHLFYVCSERWNSKWYGCSRSMTSRSYLSPSTFRNVWRKDSGDALHISLKKILSRLSNVPIVLLISIPVHSWTFQLFDTITKIKILRVFLPVLNHVALGSWRRVHGLRAIPSCKSNNRKSPHIFLTIHPELPPIWYSYQGEIPRKSCCPPLSCHYLINFS